MTSPAYSIVYSAYVSGITGVNTTGDVLITNTAGSAFVLATSANRGTRRSTGIALEPYTNNSTVEIQQSGQVSASLVPSLGAGTASWVRVSTLGQLERCTPSGSDDVCGWVETDGTFHAQFGYLTAAIVNGTGGGGGATLPIDLAGGPSTVINQLPTANQASQTLAGDVTGTTAASVISGLAVSKLAPAGTNGFVLTTTGGVPVWATPTGGYTPPTGTGYPHITAGAQDAAAVALTWTGDATGTGTGSSFALTVVKVNGASVPAAGALTTGNSAYVSGASALTYSALNLAGGSGWVTGVLPAANQAAQTMAGDVTGTTAASTVAKVNGTTYPAGGALTTGTIPRVTGASTVAYGALDLANASATTGQLPLGGMAAPTGTGVVTTTAGAWQGAARLLSNADIASAAGILASKVVQATGTGFPHVTAGALDAASIKVDTTNSAHVTVPATANGVVTSSGTVLQQAANVLAGSGYISIGATPSASGDFRMQQTSVIKSIRGGTDYNVLNISLGSFIDIGDSGGSEYISMRPGAGGIFRVLSGAAAFEAFTVTETQVQAGYPIVGLVNNTSPYSAHGKTTVTTAGTYTLVASEYSFDAIMFTATTGGTYTFPLPASDAGAYYKTIIYTGNSTAVITNGGGAPKNVSVAANTTVRCLFDTAGVHPVAAAIAYP